MPDDSTTFVHKAISRMRLGQEPQDRLWAAIYALVALVLVVGATMVIYSESTKRYLQDSRNLGFERGSVDCLGLVVDNDRDFSLPPYCQRADVALHYPPEVCRVFFPGKDACGEKWEEG